MAVAQGPSTQPTYQAFGALRVVVDGSPWAVTRRREGTVLSILLAAHGDPVPADRIVVEAWGDEAPPQALGSLQVAVSRLRARLEPQRSARGAARRLVSSAAGYLLLADVEDVDVWAFEAAVDRAAAATGPAPRLAAAEQAAALWTGEPYAGCEAPVVRREADRLGELLVGAQEIRGRALLDLGRADEAARLLSDLVLGQPYRERLWGQLAVAQYRCARQADALATVRTLRARLADDLGVDLSPELQQLEGELLRQSADLAAPTGPVREPGPAPTAPRTTVGRLAAARVVDGLVAATLAGSPTGGHAHFLLVSGEPGIGKSHLVADLMGAAERAGARALVGRCHDGDLAPSFWPWLAPLHTLSAEHPHQLADATLAPLLRADTATADLGGGGLMRLFDAVAELLERAATARPTVVVLEDVHWADTSSLRLLAHIVDAVSAERLLVVCTRRTVDAPCGPALLDTLASLSRAGAERIRLEGLGAADISALLDLHLGPHEADLDPLVEEATAGNPFFVQEYARLLQGLPATADGPVGALPVPDGARDVLRQRLCRLPVEVHTLLTAASVAGRDIDPVLLAQLVDVPHERVLDLLDLALASGLLEVRAGRYQFAHSLTREALYGDLPPARRMRLHDRAGRALEPRVEADPDLAAAVAHHCVSAAPLGDEPTARAISALGRAARAAEARYAHDESLQLWDQAADLARTPGAAEARVSALCGATRALLRAGRTAAARERVDAAVRLASDLGRWDLVADAASTLHAAGVWSWREHGTRDDAFIALLRQALDRVDAPRRARLLATLQMEHYYGMEGHLADELGEESVRLAHECADEALLLEVLFVRVVATWGPGTAYRRLEVLEEIRRHPLAAETSVLTDFQWAVTLYECNRASEADQVMAGVAVASAELRHTGVEIPLAWWRFARALDRRDPEAEVIGRAAIEQHRRRAFVAGDELECLYAVRVLPPGGRVPDEVVAAVRTANPGLRALVAFVMLEAGDPAAARDLLGDPFPPGAHHYAVLAGHCLGAAVLAATGTDEEVRTALAWILPHRGEVLTYGTVDHLGSVDYCLALCEARLGHLADALRLARDAAQLCRELDNAPWAERADDLVATLVAGGKPVVSPR